MLIYDIIVTGLTMVYVIGQPRLVAVAIPRLIGRIVIGCTLEMTSGFY